MEHLVLMMSIYIMDFSLFSTFTTSLCCTISVSLLLVGLRNFFGLLFLFLIFFFLVWFEPLTSFVLLLLLLPSGSQNKKTRKRNELNGSLSSPLFSSDRVKISLSNKSDYIYIYRFIATNRNRKLQKNLNVPLKECINTLFFFSLMNYIQSKFFAVQKYFM